MAELGDAGSCYLFLECMLSQGGDFGAYGHAQVLHEVDGGGELSPY